MNVERIELENFGSWESISVPIEPGVTLISGPNGAGKSTLLSAIEFALYGATSDAGRLIRRGTDRASVSLVVDTEEGRLHVTRTIQRSGASAKVSLSLGHEVPIGEGGMLTAATVTETQAMLEDMLGVSREVLLASAFSTQHGGAAFTEAAPRDRKRIFSTILELGLWESLHEAAKAEAKQAKDTAILARARVEQFDGAGARHEIALRGVQDALDADVEAERQEIIAQQNAERLAGEAEAAREARRQHAAAVEASERARFDHERAMAERIAADEALERARNAAANAPSVEAARALAHEADVELAEADAALTSSLDAARTHGENIIKARRSHADLLSESQTGDCARCGQPLVADVSERLTAASDLLERLENYPLAAADRSPRDAALRVAQAAHSRLAEAETIQSLAGSIDSAYSRATVATLRQMETEEALRLAIIMSKPAPVIDEDAEAKHLAALDAATHARLAHLQSAADLARAEATAQQAEREANAETEARTQHATAQHDAAIAEILATGFGPNGVPALVIDNILGQLADEANRVLTELGTPIRADLRSQRVTQAGKIVDALDIIVLDGVDEAPYETLSGGERTRVALALRAALTRLLAAKSGAQVRILVIDEPSGLDAQGAEAFADVLQAFIQARIFDTALIVTHDERLADRIDRVIRITKTPGGTSRLTENSTEPPTPPFPSGGSAEQLQEVADA